MCHLFKRDSSTSAERFRCVCLFLSFQAIFSESDIPMQHSFGLCNVRRNHACVGLGLFVMVHVIRVRGTSFALCCALSSSLWRLVLHANTPAPTTVVLCCVSSSRSHHTAAATVVLCVACRRLAHAITRLPPQLFFVLRVVSLTPSPATVLGRQRRRLRLRAAVHRVAAASQARVRADVLCAQRLGVQHFARPDVEDMAVAGSVCVCVCVSAPRIRAP